MIPHRRGVETLMAQMNFPVIHPWVEAHEGGYVNHKKDPGGATMAGVTQRTYDAWRRKRGEQRRPVRQSTAEERLNIYRENYWDKVAGDELPAGVDYAVYDFAVNSGVARAAKYVQAIVGVEQDGIIGDITIAATLTYPDKEKLIIRLCENRFAFLKRIKHPGTGERLFDTFGKGWTRRVMGNTMGAQTTDIGVIDRAVKLHRNKGNISAPPKAIADNSGAKSTVPEETLTETPDLATILQLLWKWLTGART